MRSSIHRNAVLRGIGGITSSEAQRGQEQEQEQEQEGQREQQWLRQRQRQRHEPKVASTHSAAVAPPTGVPTRPQEHQIAINAASLKVAQHPPQSKRPAEHRTGLSETMTFGFAGSGTGTKTSPTKVRKNRHEDRENIPADGEEFDEAAAKTILGDVHAQRVSLEKRLLKLRERNAFLDTICIA